MEMTELQIASEYRTGKDKSKTIKVLAELNAVTQRQIAEILQRQGEQLPGHWIEKLARPLKRAASAPATARDINDAVLRAAMGTRAEAPENREIPRSAQDDGATEEGRIATPADDRAALSLDEIRQAALELILNCGPGEPERFQGYAKGIAALVERLEEKR